MQKSRSGELESWEIEKKERKEKGIRMKAEEKANGHRRKSAGIIFSTQVIKNTILVIFGCYNKTP